MQDLAGRGSVMVDFSTVVAMQVLAKAFWQHPQRWNFCGSRWRLPIEIPSSTPDSCSRIRFNEANTLQQNRSSEVNNLQYNHENNWNYWSGHWGGYYAGLGLGAGFAIGATFAALPAVATALSVANAQYWYANGVYYAMQNGQYVIVPPPQGAIVTTPPSSCSTVYVGTSMHLDCGGAFYEPVSSGYKVIPPSVGATVTSLPDGAVSENIKGTATSNSVVRITGHSTAAAV